MLRLRQEAASMRQSKKKRTVLRSGGGMRRNSRPTVLRLDFLAVNLVSCSCPSSLRIKVIGLPLPFAAHITAMMDEEELIWQMEICTVTIVCLTSATTAALSMDHGLLPLMLTPSFWEHKYGDYNIHKYTSCHFDNLNITFYIVDMFFLFIS